MALGSLDALSEVSLEISACVELEIFSSSAQEEFEEYEIF